MNHFQSTIMLDSITIIAIMTLITRHIRSYLLLIELKSTTISFSLDNIVDASESYYSEYTAESLPAETLQMHHSIEGLFHWIEKKGKISKVNDNGEIILAQYLGKKPKQEIFNLQKKCIQSAQSNGAATAGKLVQMNKIIISEMELLKKQLSSQQSQIQRQQLEISKLQLTIGDLQKQNKKLWSKNNRISEGGRGQSQSQSPSLKEIIKLEMHKNPHEYSQQQDSEDDTLINNHKIENYIQPQKASNINGIHKGQNKDKGIKKDQRNGILKNYLPTENEKLNCLQQSESDQQIRRLSKLQSKRHKQVRKQQKYQQFAFKIDPNCPNLARFQINSNSNIIQKVKSTNEYLLNSQNPIPSNNISIKLRVQYTKYGDIKLGLMKIPQSLSQIPTRIEASHEHYLYFDGYAGKIMIDGQQIADQQTNFSAIQSGRVLEMRVGNQQVEWLLEGRTIAEIEANTQGMHPFIELYDKGDIVKIE